MKTHRTHPNEPLSARRPRIVATPFLTLFHPSERTGVREAFRSGVGIKLTQSALVEHVFLTAVGILANPNEMDGKRLAIAKRLQQAIQGHPDEAWAFAAAILEEGRRKA